MTGFIYLNSRTSSKNMNRLFIDFQAISFHVICLKSSGWRLGWSTGCSGSMKVYSLAPRAPSGALRKAAWAKKAASMESTNTWTSNTFAWEGWTEAFAKDFEPLTACGERAY